ncbi:hypothetical protein D9M68_940240 [compost metagenome]
MNVLHEEKLSTEKTNTHGAGFEGDVDLFKRTHIGRNFDNGSVSASRDYRAVSIKCLLFLQRSSNACFDFVAGGRIRV